MSDHHEIIGGEHGLVVEHGEDDGRMRAVAVIIVGQHAVGDAAPSRFNGQPGRVLVTLRSEAAAPTFDPATLWRLFKLTPAEARLALAIAAGRSLAQIGGEHQVSENTLRTQLA